MAIRHIFECGSCGFVSHPVAGGESAIMRGETATVSCRDCEKLYDVLTNDRMANVPVEERANPACPVSPAHRWDFWYFSGPCPKCGSPLRSREDTTFYSD